MHPRAALRHFYRPSNGPVNEIGRGILSLLQKYVIDLQRKTFRAQRTVDLRQATAGPSTRAATPSSGLVRAWRWIERGKPRLIVARFAARTNKTASRGTRSSAIFDAIYFCGSKSNL
jgi:hypothetical protein